MNPVSFSTFYGSGMFGGSNSSEEPGQSYEQKRRAHEIAEPSGPTPVLGDRQFGPPAPQAHLRYRNNLLKFDQYSKMIQRPVEKAGDRGWQRRVR